MNLGVFTQWDISGVGKQEAIDPMIGVDLKTLPLSKGSRTMRHTVIPSVCIPSVGGSVPGKGVYGDRNQDPGSGVWDRRGHSRGDGNILGLDWSGAHMGARNCQKKLTIPDNSDPCVNYIYCRSIVLQFEILIALKKNWSNYYTNVRDASSVRFPDT